MSFTQNVTDEPVSGLSCLPILVVNWRTAALTSYETTRLEEYHERHHNTMFHRTNALHMRNYPSDPPEYTYEPFRDTATQSICDKGQSKRIQTQQNQEQKPHRACVLTVVKGDTRHLRVTRSTRHISPECLYTHAR
jgi:hypothetical protein